MIYYFPGGAGLSVWVHRDGALSGGGRCWEMYVFGLWDERALVGGSNERTLCTLGALGGSVRS